MDVKLLPLLIGAFLLLALIRVFRSPLKLVGKLLLNTLLGFLALWLVGLTSAYTGIALEMNLPTRWWWGSWDSPASCSFCCCNGSSSLHSPPRRMSSGGALFEKAKCVVSIREISREKRSIYELSCR